MASLGDFPTAARLGVRSTPRRRDWRMTGEVAWWFVNGTEEVKIWQKRKSEVVW